MSSIPKTMKAVVLNKHVENFHNLNEYVSIEEVNVPQPKDGEVLIRVARSTVNPSDLSFVKGSYGQKPTFPMIPGFEGCGTVVKSGGGLLGWRLVNDRVAFAVPHGGAWAEYVTCSSETVITLPNKLQLDDCANAIVNPLTALSFIEIAKDNNANTILHTAAASALGKQLLKLSRKNGINVICVVRRNEQAEECKSLGAKHVFISTSETFDSDLKECCTSLNCKIAFEAVAGELTGRVFNALAKKGTLYVYGALSEQACSAINPAALIFDEKTLKGFWLTPYVNEKSLFSKMRITWSVPELLESKDITSPIAGHYPIERIAEAVSSYISNMTAGKVLIVPPCSIHNSPLAQQTTNNDIQITPVNSTTTTTTIISTQPTVEAVKNKIETFVDNTQQIVSDTKENIENKIENRIENRIDSIEDKLEDAKENIEDKLEDAKENIEDKLEDIKENIEDAIEDKLEDATSIKKKLKNKIEKKMQDVKEDVNDALDEVKEKIENL
eukprot:TRINITY_DN169_c0_g1_i1.p1 TRINITY_DN169_c0_g1~~TRINITY_DN169_c0_g1_i1.p1  ORF type:complete len:499 (-),score=261.23 TRINITY_DN169_c0_g1_i1:41-1537(-)